MCVCVSPSEHHSELPLEVVMPQLPAGTSSCLSKPSSLLAKVCHREARPAVDAHLRRHEKLSALGCRESIPVHGWIAFALCLLGNKTHRGLHKGAVVAPSSKEVTVATRADAICAGEPSGVVPRSHPGTSFPAEGIQPSLDIWLYKWWPVTDRLG